MTTNQHQPSEEYLSTLAALKSAATQTLDIKGHPLTTAHCLYKLYEALPVEVQKSFLEELVQKKHSEIEVLAHLESKQSALHNNVILGVMEDAFTVPNDFDAPLSS